jgi:hypothetical protein
MQAKNRDSTKKSQGSASRAESKAEQALYEVSARVVRRK